MKDASLHPIDGRKYMKKLILISLVAVLILSVAFGLFLSARGSITLAGMNTPLVGWNRGVSSAAPAQILAFELPTIRPMVGWNT
jgi:hypothetical protein